jgi:hypothetical protein
MISPDPFIGGWNDLKNILVSLVVVRKKNRKSFFENQIVTESLVAFLYFALYTRTISET